MMVRPRKMLSVPQPLCLTAGPVGPGDFPWPVLDSLSVWLEMRGHDPNNVLSAELVRYAPGEGIAYEFRLVMLHQPPRRDDSTGKLASYVVTHNVGVTELIPEWVPHE